MEQQRRKSTQSRPQQRRPAQQQRPGRQVQGAHFAEPQRKQRPAQPHSPQQKRTAQSRSSAPAQQKAARPAQNRQQRPPQRRPMQHPANSQRRPQQNRPRPAAQRPQQRPAGYGTRSAAAARRPQQRRRSSVSIPTGSHAMFILFLILFFVIGSIVIRACVKKAKSYMAEYEASRPQYKIAEYIDGLGDEFYHNMLRQAASGMELSAYETPNEILKRLSLEETGPAEYSYKKTEDFSDSTPSYYILRNGKAIATISIERSGWTAKYSFPEWRIGEPVSVLELDAQPVYSLSVTMPRGASLAVNGKRVNSDLYMETEPPLILTATEQNYMKQPMAVKCDIEGLYTQPEVRVTDSNGKALEPAQVPDAAEAEQVYLFMKQTGGTPDDALIQRAGELTKAYINYVVNKDAERNNNLAALNNYVLPGSDASFLMQGIYNDVYWNNPYTSRNDKEFKVQNIRMLSDKLCTVDVKFDTVLTKQISNEYAATAQWVMVNNGFNWYATSLRLLQ